MTGTRHMTLDAHIAEAAFVRRRDEERAARLTQAVASAQERLRVYRARAAASRPGLWDNDIRDAQLVLDRLRAGLPLTDYQRGTPAR